jgi:hypothetical protein
MRRRLTRSNFQMNASTWWSLRRRWSSPGLNRRVIARQAQHSFERSSQITSVARGNRRSKVARAKLPSLIHSSPACASFMRMRKAGTSFSAQCGCQTESRQITGAPVRSPSFRAKVVFPLPAQPRMTILAMIVGQCSPAISKRSHFQGLPAIPAPKPGAAEPDQAGGCTARVYCVTVAW